VGVLRSPGRPHGVAFTVVPTGRSMVVSRVAVGVLARARVELGSGQAGADRG